MNVVAARKVVREFLRQLSSEGVLLTQKQFEKLESSDFKQKGHQFNRLVGRRCILNAIHKLGLKHIRVPQKYAVLKGKDQVSVYLDHFCMSCHDLEIYAKLISGSSRKLKLEEAKEMLALITETGYDDVHRGNFILDDGHLYIIDTESLTFRHDEVNVGKVGSFFRGWLKIEDRPKFDGEFEEWKLEFCAERKRRGEIKLPKALNWSYLLRDFTFSLDEILT